MKATIKITAMTILLAIAGTGIMKAQPGRMGQGNRGNQQGFCMSIPDLTDAQKEKVTTLNEEHRKQVDQLRDEKLKAEDIYTRNEIASKMILLQNQHLKSIESLLTDSQKEYFNENILPGNAGPRHAVRNGRGFGQGRGFHAGGRGQGMGYQRGGGRGYAPGCPRN